MGPPIRTRQVDITRRAWAEGKQQASKPLQDLACAGELGSLRSAQGLLEGQCPLPARQALRQQHLRLAVVGQSAAANLGRNAKDGRREHAPCPRDAACPARRLWEAACGLGPCMSASRRQAPTCMVCSRPLCCIMLATAPRLISTPSNGGSCCARFAPPLALPLALSFGPPCALADSLGFGHRMRTGAPLASCSCRHPPASSPAASRRQTACSAA